MIKYLKKLFRIKPKYTYKEVVADITESEYSDVIVHGVNCFNVMETGLAPQMAKKHNALREDIKYTKKFDFPIEATGTIYKWPSVTSESKFIIVINAYTQYEPGANARYINVRRCLREVDRNFGGCVIGLPLIGCGIGGLEWEKVRKIIKQEIKNNHIVIYFYDEETKKKYEV